MVDSKKIAKKVLRGIGKGFYYTGKGLYIVSRAVGRSIAKEYRNSQERQRIEAEQRRYYQHIERENFHAGRGWTRGAANSAREERIGKQNRAWTREYRDNTLLTNLQAPKFNDPYPPPSKKRKKNRSIWDD